MSEWPELKSFSDLRASDFERSPVWINVHTADHDEPWYEDSDEETFRPHTGELPVDPRDGMYLVAATATLADGTALPGFLTPVAGAAEPGQMQPHVLAPNRSFGFWGGLFGIPESVQQQFYEVLGKDQSQVFPVRFDVQPGISSGADQIEVPGWLKVSR